jgi:hypothetical protein
VLNARGDKLDLVFSVADGPVSTRFANYVDEFEERALVPVLTDLLDFVVGVEGYNVDLGLFVSSCKYS